MPSVTGGLVTNNGPDVLRVPNRNTNRVCKRLIFCYKWKKYVTLAISEADSYDIIVSRGPYD